MAEVALKNVTKRFKSVTAVDGLSLDVADGEFVVLLGPTGAGKTTTLRLLAGLEKADAGEIRIGGRDAGRLEPAERDVAFVFQQYSLYPHLSVYDNLAFPLRSPARRTPEDQIKARVEHVAGLLRITHKLPSRTTQLSGGEMQRVAIGRALVREPAIYLMDEPLSSLDAKLRGELRLELKRVQQDVGATILYVTHDQTEAMTMADRIGVISAGKLLQIGTPRDIYEQPANVYVAQRLGQPQINLIPANVIANGRWRENAAVMGARTEHFRIARNASGANGTIDWIEHLGDQNHLHITIKGHKITTLASPSDGLQAGDQVSVSLDNPLWFDKSGNRIGG
ncbi:MAG: ABC transporter ATP-binding protein [Pseudomonadota bacterium]|nr:ABC transporter ATP-binding protein [Pseudomonadota bacterium]